VRHRADCRYPLLEVALIAVFVPPRFVARFVRPPRDGPEELLDGPIRGELLGSEHLAARARDAARSQRLTTGSRPRSRPRLLARLDNTRRILDAAHARLMSVTDDVDVSPAGEWLLDNYHVVQEQMREVRTTLPRGYYRELPELAGGPLTGYPRVYELAILLISHSEGRLDAENIALVLGAFQEATPLSIGELWAVPAMLRLGLLESVRRMALRTVQRLDEIGVADAWVARILAADNERPEALREVLGEFVGDPPPLSAIFVSRLLRQLRLSRGAFPPLARFEAWIGDQALQADEADAQATQRLALTQLMMANSITSMRAIAQINWRDLVEQQSVMDAVLRGDPSGDYPRMTFATRDWYRHEVERIAKGTKLREEVVAWHAIALAQEAVALPTDDCRRHVGYYLVDHGWAQLVARTGYHPGPREAIHRWVCRHPTVVFVGGLLGAALAAVGAVLWLAEPAAHPDWLVLFLLTLVPAIDVAVNAINQLVTAALPPRVLAKLDLQGHGIPDSCRSAVVIPTLLGSVAAVEEALENLEVQFLANREANLHFALLSDFTDAATETVEGDAAIVAAAVAGIHRLNARYAPATEDACYLFHRPRRWNAAQGVWMGWERKRGKLGEFNRFVRGEDHGAFSETVGNMAALRRLQYVITLDADTMLPPDAAPLLIGTLAHPLNRAVYDEARGRVVRGYGILQPRVAVSLPSAHASRFAAIHSGHPGVDPYTTAVSDVYQDLYGEGSFTGKGIYDLDIFEQATGGRFPENTLLSHDLIEGNHARAGLATDITVYDDYPARYLTWTRRKHRWIRGDWQLLAWLRRRVPGPEGRERNRLPWLSRWKILDNLRRSTVEIAQLVMLVAGWALVPVSPLHWTLLSLGAIAAPWIMSLLLAALRPPLDASWRAYYGTVARDTVTSLQQLGIAVAVLPHQAWTSIDAIARTLYRLGVSHRLLLEWQTASQAEEGGPGVLRDSWRTMAPALGTTAALVALAAWVAFSRGTSGVALAIGLTPLVLLWAAAPLITWHLSATQSEEPQLRLSDHPDLERYAELHWAYFDRFVTAETHWLVPDNFQDDPAPLLAMRTSPTNIGLQLLATVSAHELGFLTLEAMTTRLEATFGSLSRMARYRGHFYNWYDLHTLEVLPPAYISTVDSGNFAGHLVALRQACLALAAPGMAGARLEAIAERAYGLAMAMEFGFLYDEQRQLLSIGFQEGNHALDPSSYDLLASEARLASFFAIAKNDVPVEHWFRLGRTLTRASGATALVSWSGSMFEYLMPALVMRSFPSTLLDQSCQGAVARQVAHGAAHGLPWGVSESAYNLRDRHFTYQYRAFGVPDLALKRGLGRDFVVAPYASALAMQVDAPRALANLRLLEREGALGSYGFRDAIDYTRPVPGERLAVVQSFMAHHVGMALVAFTNTLRDEFWQRRFHADPLVQGAELLLHERIPRRVVLQATQSTQTAEARPSADAERPSIRTINDPDAGAPRVALLGRLPYTIMVSSGGGGYSRYEALAVTRWRADVTRDATGQFCYIRDLTTDRRWSAAHQPMCVPADWSHAVLASDRVTFHRGDGDIESRTEIAVVPDDSAEVRRVTLTNHGDEPHEIELTSYGEIVLAPGAADRAHPAFSSLFVQTEWHPWCSAITATRRPRSVGEAVHWCVHVVATSAEQIGAVSCESDRARFLGRGRTLRDPAALVLDGPLSGTTGPVLDPVFAIRTRIRLAPGQSGSVAFTTLVATTRARAFELAGRYHDPHAAQRALDLAWTSTQAELRELQVTPLAASLYQDLAGHLLYSTGAFRAPQEELFRSRGSQPLLWAHGISGDWPILLAIIDGEEGMSTLRELFAAHHYWRRRGMMVDLVVLNGQTSSYLQAVNDSITAMMFSLGEATVLDRPGGVFVRRADQLGADDLLMLRTTARVLISCDGRSLETILRDVAFDGNPTPTAEPERRAPAPRSSTQRASRGGRMRQWLRAPLLGATLPLPPIRPTAGVLRRPAPDAARAVLQFDNGFGGLTAEHDYQIRVQGDDLPPAPWVNVVANPFGGFVVSERGAGFTWAGNSYFYRLTPWHNDAVSDPISDVLYLRDEESGDLWSATPAPLGDDIAYVARHAPGRSVFEHEHRAIRSELTLGMIEGTAIRVSCLRLANTGTVPRRLSLTAYIEWTLGVLREQTQHHVRTEFAPALNAILARNPFDPQFADRVAFAALSDPATSHTGDRHAFLGPNGTVAHPAALGGTPGSGLALVGRTGAGMDPCAALQCLITLAPGETRDLVVLLGAAGSEAEARTAIATWATPTAARDALGLSEATWAARLSVVAVGTPEPAFDALLNRWLLYQTLACRLWARSALYQSGGAYGFRDQLQDVMALVLAEPGLAREHILRAAGRQFVEGDVQHWWHAESGRGTRTRFSDDLAWLPYVVDHYVRVTGDSTLLDDVVPFLTMRTLEPHEDELYDQPRTSSEVASVYEHCLRAIRKASTRGPHGLPLIGSGDWNDGMSRVGIGGIGESVWLGWFLVTVARRFADHADARQDHAAAALMRAQASAYVEAIETAGWDGDWYRRAFFDDGAVLGSASNEECRIDAIAQSWSVLSGAGRPERQAKAMQALEEQLVREDGRLIMLLTPPFDRGATDPGYIKGYLPGVRENGAQYTHAALWAVLAVAEQGRGERAFELFQMLNPLMHARTPEEVATYKVEPYVVAADVYTVAGQLGRGGWTWYTGAASWMYRVGLEGILGFRKRGNSFTIAATAPPAWPVYTIAYRFGASRYLIEVRNPDALTHGRMRLTVDGLAIEGHEVALVDDGRERRVVAVREP
jgi:cyclic beta-1,2-glucan synthetase